jgi:gamma-glutamyltranspeptidase/glutathione hydrolase
MSSEAPVAGKVVADEARAVLVGRNILESGGSAADAVAAMGLAMTVTYPVAVGLGGGGQCVVYDPKKGGVASYDFRLRDPARGGPIGVPGFIRGIALMQVRHGALDWTKVVLPAENLARGGATVTRALAKPLAANVAIVDADPNLSNVFRRADGTLLRDGHVLEQLPLAATLGLIRSRGVSDFYQGEIAKVLVDASKAAGGTLTMDDLRAYRVDDSPAVTRPVGNNTMILPAGGSSGVAAFDRIFAAMAAEAGAAPPARAVAMAKATEQAYAGAPNTTAGVDDGSGVAVATDAQGGAAACAFSLGRPLGAGRMSPMLGMVLGAAPAAGRGGRFMIPMLVINTNSKLSYFAGAAATDDSAPAGLMTTWLDSMGVGASDVGPAIGAPRLIDAGGGIVYEPGTPADVASALQGTGQRTIEAGPLGRAAAIWCPNGNVSGARSCSAAPDPRGSGLAETAIKRD